MIGPVIRRRRNINGAPSVSVVDPFIDACTEDPLTELHDKEKEDAPRQLPLPGEVVRR